MAVLPPLRADLDLLPSPVPERPGLLIRDPFQYSPTVLIVPAPLVACLRFFDGEQTENDLRAYLVRATGELQIGALVEHLASSLGEAGFLEDERFAALRDERHRAFAASPVRDAIHSDGSYPADADACRTLFNEYLDDAEPARPGPLRGIAAPHVSPCGGSASYAAAYGAAQAALGDTAADTTFVVLGTSHYGAPDRFGLTRKPFVTPYGHAQPAAALINELEHRGGEAVAMEDYCHAIEHSIEFQVIFLQHVFGPSVRVLPILCGPFSSVRRGGFPEQHDHVRRFLETLGDITAREGKRLFYVLGVDMAHIGSRYGDEEPVTAHEGVMEQVATLDRQRIGSLLAGDARGYWEQVRENGDELRWCGAAPLYTFSHSVPGVGGALLRYEQWNIDEESVVSFAGLAFS